MAAKMQAAFSTLYLDEELEVPTEKQQTQSPLMRLSAELRNKIYKMTAESEDVALHVDFHVCRPKGCKLPAGIALLMTCKQIQREAFDLIWDNLTFKLEIEDLLRTDCDVDCKDLGLVIFEKAPILSKLRNMVVHFEPQSAPHKERLKLEERNATLQDILLRNVKNITHLELLSYGHMYAKFTEHADTALFRNAMKTNYQEQFGRLLQALQEEKVPVWLYDPCTKKMERTYEFALEELFGSEKRVASFMGKVAIQ